MSQLNETNTINIRVHEFFTEPSPVKDAKGKETGEIKMFDWVKYGPPQAMDRSATIARVDKILSAPAPKEENMAMVAAAMRRDYIRPRYEAWKKGEEIPNDEIPLAACNFLRKEEVDVLKRNGVRSVEELAGLLDHNLDGIKVPMMRAKRDQAKRFLEAQDTNKAAARIAASEAKADETARELVELRAQMAQMMAAKTSPEDEPEVDGNGDKLPKKRKTLGLPQQAA